MRTLPCFKCGKDLRPIVHDARNQPCDGVVFNSPGQYGSTVFDEIDGAKLEINICDACLVKGRANVLHMDGIPRREWKSWEPDCDREHLAALLKA